jgi:hypothetical protein
VDFYIALMRELARLPALVSGILLLSLWRGAEIFGWQTTAFVAWFVLALVLQFGPLSSSLWLIGLLAQVALSLVLLMKERISQIY